jgi:hypothetical protein
MRFLLPLCALAMTLSAYDFALKPKRITPEVTCFFGEPEVINTTNKDAHEIVMGFPGVYNWMSSARVNDPEAKAVLMQAQKDFEAVLKTATE